MYIYIYVIYLYIIYNTYTPVKQWCLGHHPNWCKILYIKGTLALKHLKLQAGYSTAHRGDWGILPLSGRMRVDHFPHGENWEVFKHQFKMHDLCCHDKGWISFLGCLCLFWVSISEKPFRNDQGILFPDGLSDPRIQHIHTQPGPVERLCGAFGISCQELQGWIGNRI